MKKKRWLPMLVTLVMVIAMATPVYAVSENLITNGDFESGNTGFTSEYGYVSAQYQNSLQPPLVYAIGTNPLLFHSGWTPGFGDHTSGTGKMMIVNGTTVEPPAVVWGQNVSLPACEPVVTTYPLYAGQTWQVGEVLVSNIGGNICVEYKLFDAVAAAGWRITETHVAVATTSGGIPQTKTGNPIPGEFPYGESYDPGVTSDKFCIPFTCAVGNQCVIAAHAVVNKPSTSHTENGSFCVASGTDTKLGDNVLLPATLAWVHPSWNSNLRDAVTNNPSDLYNYADWVWDSYYNPTPRNGDLVNLYQEFQIPDGATITSAELKIAADNAFSWKLNAGTYTDVNLAGDWRSQTVFSYPTFVIDPSITSWKKVYTYDVTSQISSLANALYVTGVNAAWNTDDPTVNPSGVLYKLCGTFTQEVSDNNAGNDSAWGGTTQFKGKNWATYLSYTCQACPTPTYQFKFYAKNSYTDPSPAQLQVSITGFNGTVRGATLTGITKTLVNGTEWNEYTFDWTPGPTTTNALIEIRDLRIAYTGNDFCIDDISFVKLP